MSTERECSTSHSRKAQCWIPSQPNSNESTSSFYYSQISISLLFCILR